MDTTLDTIHTTYPFPRVIDNTMYELWKTCPHKFFRSTVQGLKAAQRHPDTGELVTVPNRHLHFGGAIARGLEVTRRKYLDGADPDHAVRWGAEALIGFWAAGGELPPPRTRTEEAKTLEACLLAHSEYFNYFPLDDPQHEIPSPQHVEISAAWPIPGTVHPETGEPIIYAGRFDAICRRFGPFYGLDDKTTGGGLDGNWAQQWKLRGQFLGYRWLAGQYGYKFDNFLVHGIQVLKTKIAFAEALVPTPQWLVTAWLHQLQADVDTMCRQYKWFCRVAAGGTTYRDQPHPFRQRFGEACFHFNAPCMFLDDICAQPNPDDWIENAFIVERWNPLERAQQS